MLSRFIWLPGYFIFLQEIMLSFGDGRLYRSCMSSDPILTPSSSFVVATKFPSISELQMKG